jgi:prepilin-type processing-associated H-X9-DG protein
MKRRDRKRPVLSSPRWREDHLGFTLVELLIVLAFIALITAILFPVFARTREKARQGTCLSNLRQIAIASQMYAQNYDDTFLWNPSGEGTPGDVVAEQISERTGEQRRCADHPCASWAMLLQPYLKSWAVLRCPSFPADLSPDGRHDPSGYSGSGYGINAVLLADDCQPRSVDSLRHSPSEVALIGDSAVPWSGIWVERAPDAPWPDGWADAVSLLRLDQWSHEVPPPDKMYWGWQLALAPAAGWGPGLHNGGSNFAFADGHAQFLRPSDKVILPATLPVISTVTPGRPEDSKAGSFPGALLE